jgi:hypothetical protein
MHPGRSGTVATKTAPLIRGERLDHDRIFEPAHCALLTASMKATSFRISKNTVFPADRFDILNPPAAARIVAHAF